FRFAELMKFIGCGAAGAVRLLKIISEESAAGWDWGRAAPTPIFQDFAGCEAAVEDFKFINAPIFEARITEPASQRQVNAPGIALTPFAAMNDVLEKIIAHDIHRQKFAVQVKVDACCLAGAIVSDGQVRPLIHRKRGPGAYLEAIPRPEVNEAEGRF